MGKKHAEEMDFWTREEFNTFIKYFEDKPKYQKYANLLGAMDTNV